MDRTRLKFRLTAAALAGLALNLLVSAALWNCMPDVQGGSIEQVASVPPLVDGLFESGDVVYHWSSASAGVRLDTYAVPAGATNNALGTTRPVGAILSVGWPCLSVDGAFCYRTQRGFWAVLEPKDWVTKINSRRFVPLRPLAAGVVVNSVFYGSIVWFAAFGIARWRSQLRARRGLCRQCAYPLAGSCRCPECGAPV